MAETVQFDLVSPERRLASVQASAVQIPGSEGDMTAMAGHAPVITTLRPGVLRVTHAAGTDEFVVSGGFAEITGASVSVLAEEALPRGEVDQATIDRLVAVARVAADAAAGDAAVAKVLADTVAMGESLGLTARA